MPRKITENLRAESLTVREHFAAMAMQGLCADPNVNANGKIIAKASVKLADDLINELNKSNG